MYIDPKTPKIGSLYGSQPVGASVQQLLGLSEKIVPTAGISWMITCHQIFGSSIQFKINFNYSVFIGLGVSIFNDS